GTFFMEFLEKFGGFFQFTILLILKCKTRVLCHGSKPKKSNHYGQQYFLYHARIFLHCGKNERIGLKVAHYLVLVFFKVAMTMPRKAPAVLLSISSHSKLLP